MTRKRRPRPVNEIAVAAASRRLDALVAEHPELVGPRGPHDVSDWIDVLKTDDKGRQMAKEPTTQLAFRLPDNLIKRLDRHVARMTAANPGLEITRVAAVRSLLTSALDQAEAAAGKRR